jgi:hypothetical protein
MVNVMDENGCAFSLSQGEGKEEPLKISVTAY